MTHSVYTHTVSLILCAHSDFSHVEKSTLSGLAPLAKNSVSTSCGVCHLGTNTAMSADACTCTSPRQHHYQSLIEDYH